MPLLTALAPELVLIVVACALFFLGTVHKAAPRRLSAMIALGTLAIVFVWQGLAFLNDPSAPAVAYTFNVVRVGGFSAFVKAMVAGVGAVLVLLAWPGNRNATGSASMDFGEDVGEFFAMGLLSLAGVFLVASANDLILLFLAIELAAIPTYIIVSISRPLPVAQEAGVKYFFLGAMAAAVLLFGFSYVYGATGQIRLDLIEAELDKLRDPATNGWGPPTASTWLVLGLIVLLVGFAFKIAAVPFHTYVGDVYQGAATPVTALIAFVPKTSGFLAILKVLAAVGGPHYAVPPVVVQTLWVVALLTMTFGNVLGLLQLNVKRVLAYSSVAHSGYVLVAVTALVTAGPELLARAGTDPAAIASAKVNAAAVQQSAIVGVLFYLATYGLMNAGALGFLMLFPTRAHTAAGDHARPLATTAETFEDLAGLGKNHPALGLGMAICCFSLTGLPLTVGFLGKIYLIAPALQAKMPWLVGLTLLNAAISAAYYLKIVATLFVRPLPAHAIADEAAEPIKTVRSAPLSLGVGISVATVLGLGLIWPLTDALTRRLGAAGATITQPAGPKLQQTASASE